MVDFAEKDVSYKKNANAEKGTVEKNAKRAHILKTVELADFAEQNLKRIRILKDRESSNASFGRTNQGRTN